jgi:hypothetical protein
MLDFTVYEAFRSMSAEERLESITRIGQPEMQRALLAMKRYPLPLDDRARALVEPAWEQHVATAHPKEVASLSIGVQNFEWSKGLVRTLTQSLVSPPREAPHVGALERMSLYRLAKPTDALTLFDFAPHSHEVIDFERRIAAAA